MVVIVNIGLSEKEGLWEFKLKAHIDRGLLMLHVWLSNCPTDFLPKEDHTNVNIGANKHD